MARQSTLKRSILKGVLAGLAGGLAGSAAKLIAEKLFPPRTAGQTAPPQLLVERAEFATDVPLSDTQERAATQGIHWGFGTLIGGVYGGLAEFQPSAAAWRGGAFGLTVNKLAHEGILPKMGLVEPPAEQPAQERVSEWVTHVVYGVVTDTVRRSVRKRL